MTTLSPTSSIGMPDGGLLVTAAIFPFSIRTTACLIPSVVSTRRLIMPNWALLTDTSRDSYNSIQSIHQGGASIMPPKNKSTQPATMTTNSYGKSRVRLTKIIRQGDNHDIKELNVNIQVQGEFDRAYLSGDNSQIVATD